MDPYYIKVSANLKPSKTITFHLTHMNLYVFLKKDKFVFYKMQTLR